MPSEEHQDKYIEGVYEGIGPISLEAKFNILMDRLAERRRVGSNITLHTIPFKTEWATLVVAESIVTTKISDYITYAEIAPPMIAYIREKNDWSTTTFHKVDWDAMGRYIGKLSAKVVKLQHNRQNTGQQKGLFLASAAGANQDDINAATRCPMGCGAYKAPLHYLSCSKNPRMAELKFGITEIKRWVKHQDTAPVLRTIVTRILH